MSEIAMTNFEMIAKRTRLDGLLLSMGGLFELTNRQRSVLRQGQQATATDPEVRKVREDLDALLDALSFIEVGNIAHALPEGMPGSLGSRVLDLLSHPDVKVYYLKVRPLLLIQSLAQRVSGNVRRHDMGQQCLVIFMSFAHSEGVLEERGLEELSLLLEGEVIGKNEYRMQDLLEVFGDAEAVWARLSQPVDEADALDRALQGFQRFYSFAQGFGSLLREAQGHPLLQSSMWHYHSFWFKEHARPLMAVVERFCDGAVLESAEPEDRAEAVERASRMKALFVELTDEATFGRPLEHALQQGT